MAHVTAPALVGDKEVFHADAHVEFPCVGKKAPKKIHVDPGLVGGMIGYGKFQRMDHHLGAAEPGAEFKAAHDIPVVFAVFPFAVPIAEGRVCLGKAEAQPVGLAPEAVRQRVELAVREKKGVLLHGVQGIVYAVKASLANQPQGFQLAHGVADRAVVGGYDHSV